MQQLLFIFNDIIVIFFDLFIFTRLIILKKDRLFEKVLMYSGCTTIILAYFTAVYLMEIPASIASAVCMSIPSFLLFFYLSKHKDSRFFLTFCFVDSISLIIAFLGRYIGILSGNTTGNLIMLITTTLLFLFVIYVGKNHFKKYHDLLEIPDVGWLDMAVTSALIYFGLLFFAAYPKPLIERIEYGPAYFVFSVIIISCYIVFIHSILKTKKINDQKKTLQREKEIYKIAYTDAMTGLYNRASYIEKVNAQREALTEEGRLFCIVWDLDSLKQINDSKGHLTGDLAIQTTAKVLKEVFSEWFPYLFRLGGDEFAVFLRAENEQEIRSKIAAVQQLMEQESAVLGITLSVSAGYAHLSDAPQDALEKVFERADQEMYKNKTEKRKDI